MRRSALLLRCKLSIQITMIQTIFAKVASQTEPGKFYTVRRLHDGEIRCDCPHFVFGKDSECKHIKEFKQTLLETKN